MLRAKVKNKRISVHIRTSTKKTLGRSETWPISYVLWGSALPFKPVIVNWDENQSSSVLWKLTFQGERDFNIAETRFSRLNNTYIWQPISVTYIPSDTPGVGMDTLIECSRIDKLI